MVTVLSAHTVGTYINMHTQPPRNSLALRTAVPQLINSTNDAYAFPKKRIKATSYLALKVREGCHSPESKVPELYLPKADARQRHYVAANNLHLAGGGEKESDRMVRERCRGFRGSG